jgi:hypothetical protein
MVVKIFRFYKRQWRGVDYNDGTYDSIYDAWFDICYHNNENILELNIVEIRKPKCFSSLD